MHYKELDINDEKTFEVVVVATMSSGKSTLVNALIGDDILPSRNEACTARTTMICDNDKSKDITIHMIDEGDNYKKIVGGNADIIEQYNDSKVKSLILECDITGIRNLKKSLVLVDTPGTNNNNDKTHEEITLDYIEKLDDGMILFVLDATHTETEDEKRLLEVVRDKIASNSEIKIIFVINKFDEVDFEKESPFDFVERRRKYLSKVGFNDFDIVTLSAQAAKIFKKMLKGRELSKMERFNLSSYYELFKGEGTNFKNYTRRKNEEDRREEIAVNGKTYTRGGIISALDNTGILNLEELIEERMIDDCLFRSNRIKKVKEEEDKTSVIGKSTTDIPAASYMPLIRVTNGIIGVLSAKGNINKEKSISENMKKIKNNK